MKINISEDTIASFVEQHLVDGGFAAFMAAPDLQEFAVQVKAGNDIKAAEIYHQVRGGSIEESILVSKIAARLATDQ